MDWNQILQFMGGIAVVVRAGAWLVQSSISHLFSRELEKFKLELESQYDRETRSFEKQIEIYSRFLVWDRAGLDDKAIAESCRSRTLLAVYASVETIKAIADFDRLGGIVRTDEQKNAFVRMFNAIRRDSNLPPLDRNDLLTLMYLNEETTIESPAQQGAAGDALSRAHEC
jgi:hypothetical protein